MIAQRIDHKKKCALLISETNDIFESEDFSGITGTWSYFEGLPEGAAVAQLISLKKDISQACPEALRERWESVNKKMGFVKKSLKTAKVDCDKNCLYEIVPEHLIVEYFQVKNQITKHVLTNYEKPEVYDHLYNTSKLVSQIKKKRVKIATSSLKKDLGPSKINRFFQKLKKLAMFIDYDIFGTKTGRLTCKKNTFPILNLDKELRKYIIPENDLFLEIDVNGAELRALLFLLGKKQPEVDIHEWNCKNLFANQVSRDQAKKRVFAWLYNIDSRDALLDKEYDRNFIKEKYFDGNSVITPYGRSIKSDEFHSINYVLQSFSSDMLLEQAQKISEFLQDKKSSISFLMHDSVIVDFCKEDIKYVEELVNMFENTRFGKTKANLRIGKDLLNLKELTWKK